MEKGKGLSGVDYSYMFEMMYDARIEKSDFNGIASLNNLLDNIESEGFVSSVDDQTFAYRLYKVILSKYATDNDFELALNQMWKLFIQLQENGIDPSEAKARELYLLVARELMDVKRDLLDGRLAIMNKGTFLANALKYFDTSMNFYRSLKAVGCVREASIFYKYYAKFIETVAPVCPYESMLYALLREQIKEMRNNNYKNRRLFEMGEFINACGESIKRDMTRINSYGDLREARISLFDVPLSTIVNRHALTQREADAYKEEWTNYPAYIKKPSKRLYIPEPTSLRK